MPKFSPSVLRQYCYDVMTASGVDSVCAEATAEMLVDAEVTGMSTHGVSRLSIYMERIQAGIMSPNNNIRIVQEAPSALTVDAGNSLGAAAAKFTMTKCIEKARETGVCFAAVRNSNHFGTAAFYTKMAAEAGMMGLCCANLKGNVAPFGAAEPYLAYSEGEALASADGEVMSVARDAVGRSTVRLRHDSGMETLYGNLIAASVREGDRVKAGQVLGVSRALMYEMRAEGLPTDPAPYLQ